MRIGLIDIEPNITNAAYMQIAMWHKEQGDYVEWAMPLAYDSYDKLYCSSLFDFTNKRLVPNRAICGGTGFDISKQLQFEADYDYSIYPECDYSIMWFSRGCIRNCPFCIVQQKEGNIKPVEVKPPNPNGKYVVVQDNNFFANPMRRGAIDMLNEIGQPVDMQGVDLRILDDEQCESLLTMTHYKKIKVAWDNPEDDLRDKLKWLVTKIKPWRLMCYVLIGYWSTPKQDLDRVMFLDHLDITPFAMPYNKTDEYQKRFARWVNHRATFKSCAWKDYKG